MDTIVETGASPQIEDGHIKIANEIGEALAKTNFSAYEMRILWVLWRKTYGWHKKVDQISITQFQKATGLHRRHVQRTLKRLMDRKIVASTGYSKTRTYQFQKDYTKWKDVTSKGYPAPKEATDSSLKRRLQKHLTKAKDSRSQKTTDPRVKEFFTYWRGVFLHKTGHEYVFSGGKEGQLVKDLLRDHTLPTLQDAVKQFFRNEEAQRRGFDIGTFRSMFNRIVAIRTLDPLEQAKREMAKIQRETDEP